MHRKDLLNSGFLILEDYMANDLAVVNSARVSFLKHASEMTQKEEGLINFLMRERHGTPFEHNAFTFHVRCPIFVAREWMRHRIGSFNEHSQRYSEAINDYYIPDAENVRIQKGKAGAYTFESADESDAIRARDLIKYAHMDAFEVYYELLGMGIAKEVARIVLPVATYTEFYWTLNARSLMNFISLRNTQAALYEIRVYAEALEEMLEAVMPVTYRCFVEHGRKAP